MGVAPCAALRLVLVLVLVAGGWWLVDGGLRSSGTAAARRAAGGGMMDDGGWRMAVACSPQLQLHVLTPTINIYIVYSI
jgi:hypothetical protein